MKKGLTTLLVILLAVGAMLVSCKAEIGTPADELVSASFELDSSRALSATLDDWKPETYYWKYAAKKNAADTSGLTSGTTTAYTATGAEWVKVSGGAPVAGLAGHIVPNFSQGLWDFQLFAYKLVGSEYKLIYQGEAKAVTLVKGGTNMVHVVVSPLPTGNGTLVIGTTSLKPRETTDVPTVSRSLKVENLDGQQYYPTTGTTYDLAAGAYKVTVSYMASGILYAEGTVIATVYPNMTTTVTGTVDELVTYAQFEAEQNPDIIARTAGVDGIHKNDNVSDKYTLTEKGVEAEDVKVTATVPAAAAKNLLPKDGEGQIIADASMSLMLNVDTKDSTSTSVTYEISMTKVVTLDSEVTTSDVTDLGKDAQNKKYYATAMVQLSKGLTGVKVQHDGHDMKESTSTADDQGYGIYSYDATTGILTIVTNTFSPFAVTYDGQTAGVAELNGKKYATLVAACEALPQGGGTITLLCDAEGAGLFLPANFNMTIVLDLNGHTYTCTGPAVGSTGTATQALHLEENNNVTAKNGKITSTPDSGVKMLVQNYCDLTLEDVILDGSNIGAGGYTLSNNCGNVSIKGKTDIYAPTNGRAFDVCGYSTYSAGVAINVATTGTISGKIEIDEGNKGYPLSLNISNGTFLGSIVGTAKTSTEEMKEIISITGGTFSWNPTDYVADGYTVDEIEGGKYKVVEKVWVFSELVRDAKGNIVTDTVGDLEYCTEIQQVWGKTETREISRRLLRFTVTSAGNSEGTSDSAATKFNVTCGSTTVAENVTLNDLTGRSTNYETIDSRLVRGDVILLPAGDIVVFGNSGTPSSIQELTIVGQEDVDGNNTTIHCISNATNQYRILRIYNRGLHGGHGFGEETVYTNFLDVNFTRSDSNSSAGTALIYITDYNVQLTMKNVKVSNFKSALISCWACGPTESSTTNGMPLKEDNAGADIYLTNVDISNSTCTSVMAAECYPASDKVYSAENWMYRALNYTTDCTFGTVPVCVNKDNHSIEGQENCFVNGELVDWARPKQQ